MGWTLIFQIHHTHLFLLLNPFVVYHPHPILRSVFHTCPPQSQSPHHQPNQHIEHGEHAISIVLCARYLHCLSFIFQQHQQRAQLQWRRNASELCSIPLPSNAQSTYSHLSASVASSPHKKSTHRKPVIVSHVQA